MSPARLWALDASREGGDVIRAAGPADAPGIARVHVDAWRSTYRGIVPQAFLDALSHRNREALWERVLSGVQPGHFVALAEDAADGIVGFAHGGPGQAGHPEYAAELYAIYVLEAYQGRGLGRDLTLAVVARLVADGRRSMLVWVLADNPACRFYEALGGRRVEVKRISIGGAELDEVAYGWTDLTPLSRGET